MQAVIYARYSSHNQTEQSIEGQLRECVAFAEKNEMTVVKHYIDRAKTGTNDNRAAFQQMLKESEKRIFDAVVVWKIDRFGRNREEIAINKVRLRKNGVKVMYAQEHIPDSPEGVLIESCLEGVAEYYSKSLSQNIMRGMRTAALKCHSTGPGLSLGYGVAEDKSFYIVEKDAAIVRQIFEMYAEGKTYVEIIKHVNAKGCRTIHGNPFGQNAVRRILQNRRYIGEYKWHDVVVPDGMPRIISNALFERCQKRLEKNKKAPARKISDYGEVFLLTGKLFCGRCGATMIGDSATGSKGYKYWYYTCSTKKHRKGCKKKSVRKDDLERIVVETTVDLVFNDALVDFIAKKAIAVQEKERQDKSNLSYLKTRLKETEAALINVMRAIEQGIITATTKARLEELEAEKRDIEGDIAMEQLERPVITYDHIVYFLKSFRNGDIKDKEYQRRVIDTFVNAIYLYDDKITITYNYTTGENAIAKETVELLAGTTDSDSMTLSPP